VRKLTPIVRKGGAFYNNPSFCRCSTRLEDSNYRLNVASFRRGFRVIHLSVKT